MGRRGLLRVVPISCDQELFSAHLSISPGFLRLFLAIRLLIFIFVGIGDVWFSRFF